MMQNVIITAPVHPVLIKTFQEKGFTVIYEPSITYMGLMMIINQAVGLVVSTRVKVDKALLNRADQLKWIGRIGSGMEKIDVNYAAEKGIAMHSTPEGNRQAVAEHVLGLILNLYNNITKSYLEIKEGFWFRKENTGIEISGKTIGIIGFGNNGSRFAKLLQPFGVKVLAFDKYKTGFGQDYIHEATLEQIAQEADIISYHVPLTNDTKHIINADYLNTLERMPLLVNASRGGTMNTQHVIQALKTERIFGLAIDVLENEDLSILTDEEEKQLQWLLNQTNVIVTPHIAGYTHEANFKMATCLLEKLGLIPPSGTY